MFYVTAKNALSRAVGVRLTVEVINPCPLGSATLLRSQVSTYSTSMIIGSTGSNVGGGGEGVEMGERRGSKFGSDNPMHKEAEAAGREGAKKKKKGKSLFKRFEDELMRRHYERQYVKKPSNPNVKRDKQYEDPVPGPPPES